MYNCVYFCDSVFSQELKQICPKIIVIVQIGIIPTTLLLLDIGPGWTAAIINNPLELEFIEKQHKTLRNEISFFLGGSTLGMGSIELSDYMKHPPCQGNQNNNNSV